MSSRVLRKLKGKDDFVNDNEEESDENSQNLKSNRFDMFYQQPGFSGQSESEFKEDDNETENMSANTSQHEKIKKKRKNKKKRKTKPQTRSSEDNADAEEDEITKTVKIVDKMFGQCDRSETPDILAQSSPSKNLLTIHHKNLNPQFEMKRIFGSKVIHAEQQKRNQHRNQRAAGPSRPLKSIMLVSPKENWPPVSKIGIYMNLVQPLEDSTSTVKKPGNEKNLIYFAFEHSSTYRQIQEKFLTAVESMNSDFIVQIINEHPYHVDSLIQLSELCKMSEDMSMAADLIEHAIFAMESSFHSMFNLTQGNCRLEYRRQENRAFFICLFKHAQFLEARACSRTALEIVKLIFTLDSSDPLACLLIIDYYALRSKQYDFLVQLYSEWEATHNLSQLPNMAYSYALALFHSKKLEAADEAIQYALTMFPGVLKTLLKSLSIQADSRVSSHKYFGANSFINQSMALQQLVSLYVCRSKSVWCDTDILPWLEKNVNIVLDRVDAKDEIVSEYTAKRNQRYVNPPRSILRHVILSDFKEQVPIAYFLKKETEPILHYDVLPPLDSVNTYTKPKMTPDARTQGSAFSVFFQSLLPSFNLQEPTAQQQQALNRAVENEEEGARGGPALIPLPENNDPDNADPGNDFRNSLNSIVETLRNFLSNNNYRNNAGDVDENDSSDDDPNNYLT